MAQLLQADPEMGINKIQAVLKERTGNGHKAEWVKAEKLHILARGSVLTETP